MPPSNSGIADYVAEGLPLLAQRFDVVGVVEDPAAVDASALGGMSLCAPGDRPETDLDLYHVGNSPAHGYVYRAALARPGVVVLHEWNLHHLVLQQAVERGQREPYLREMGRDHGDRGAFVGRQVARGLGGDLLPALFPLNDRLLESALAVVGLTDYVASRAALRLGRRPVLHLAHHFAIPLSSLPDRAEARLCLGLPEDALIVTAPGMATAAKRLDVAIRVIARLRARWPDVRLVVAGQVDRQAPLEDWATAAGLGDALVVTGRLDPPSFTRHLAAADVVLSLRFPTYGEISGALVRALGVGRPALVTAGTPAAQEFPEGVVLPVDPGPREAAELEAFLSRLLSDAPLREAIGRIARAHMAAHHDLERTTNHLALFLGEVGARRGELEASRAAEVAPVGGLGGRLMDELRVTAQDLDLFGLPLGLEPLARQLTPEGVAGGE